MVKVKVKKLHPDAILPKYAKPGDAGMDIFSVEDLIIKAGKRAIVHTGIAMEYEPGYCTLIWDKSGMAGNAGVKTMGGVFEHTYRGEYLVILHNNGDQDYQLKKGQKVAQVLVQPIITADIEEAQELSESVRGANGFGSTGA